MRELGTARFVCLDVYIGVFDNSVYLRIYVCCQNGLWSLGYLLKSLYHSPGRLRGRGARAPTSLVRWRPPRAPENAPSKDRFDHPLPPQRGGYATTTSSYEPLQLNLLKLYDNGNHACRACSLECRTKTDPRRGLPYVSGSGLLKEALAEADDAADQALDLATDAFCILACPL